MNHMKKFTLLLIGICLLTAPQLFAQRSCSTMEYLQQQIQNDPHRLQVMEEIEQHNNQFIQNYHPGDRAVIVIPVVFHVVYNTSAQNISDALIAAQIDQLNQDYARLNADAVNTPSVFQSLGANTQIQFCLAQRDPNGNATTGIIRKSTTVTSFTTNDKIKYAANGGDNAWPSSSYLNIWTGNLSGGLLGYAQFPGGAAATDGVVILYSSVGSIATPGTASPYNFGRTATHEIGHWLNLRHIWGDATCGNDLVDDTPVHYTSNGGCPTHPKSNSCGTSAEMFMNYMDYTTDGCMNIFTLGQSARMNAVFAPGGARASITSSMGCVPPGGGTSCGTPSGLSASSITTSSATLSWTAVAGATSYNVQVKASASSTWSTSSTTGTSINLTDLSASTSYDYQIQAVCSGTNGSFSSIASFTTSSAGVSCGTPTGLAASSVTATTATISWTAVNGATSYNVQVKPASSSTWSTGSTTGTSINLTGLTASTTYNYQVQAVCSGTNGSFSAIASFTTPSNATCTDNYEPNNSQSAAKVISVNSTIQALIGTSSDNDYFKFTTTSSSPKVKINLTNLPADYDLRLYNSSGSQIGISQNGGTTSEQIIYNSSTKAATYYVRVYGYNGAYSTTSCYSLTVTTQSSNFKEDGTLSTVTDDDLSFVNVYPNPNNGSFNVDYFSKNNATLNVYIMDITGRIIYNGTQEVFDSMNTFQIYLPGLSNGIYLMNIVNGEDRRFKRFIIQQ